MASTANGAESSEKDHSTHMRELEDKAKSEISELYLLLKSGTLTEEERASITEKLKGMIKAVELEQKRACCK